MAVVKLTKYDPVLLSVIELTLPLPFIATVPVPLNLTQALAPKIGAEPDCAPSKSAALMHPSGNPPALMPVIVPVPSIVIAMAYTS